MVRMKPSTSVEQIRGHSIRARGIDHRAPALDGIYPAGCVRDAGDDFFTCPLLKTSTGEINASWGRIPWNCDHSCIRY
jgi:hypothetical protein